MSITHDTVQSSPGSQVFWLEIEGNGSLEYNAQFRAWLAIGHDEIGDQDELNGYQKARWKMAYAQALQLEAIKAAYGHDAVKWLIKQDVDVDVNPFTNGWLSWIESTEVKVTIENADNKAALFKLAFAN